MSDESGLRLQKVLAQAGLGSRRACEDLITAGRVSVGGRVVRQLGTRVDPATAVIHVDGQRVPTAPDQIVLAINKPRGMHTTMSDDRGRPCIGDLLADRPERLFHVGRLDADTEGLLLVTNDGDLAHRLAHPSHEIAKTYMATIPGPVPREVGRRLKAGVELDDGPARVDDFRVTQSLPGKALVQVTLHEGRNRIVRRLLDAVGHPVESLVRTQIGPIRLGQLKPGRSRVIEGAELRSLYTAAGM